MQPFHPNLDYTFVSSVSSLHFLASNNFDFNKLIYHGIPWLRRFPSSPLRPPTALRKGKHFSLIYIFLGIHIHL
jgi:hypothetical protein